MYVCIYIYVCVCMYVRIQRARGSSRPPLQVKCKLKHERGHRNAKGNMDFELRTRKRARNFRTDNIFHEHVRDAAENDWQ